MEIPVATITQVLLTDKEWHVVTGVASIDYDPAITDPATGASVIPVAGPWLRFTEDKQPGTVVVPIAQVFGIRIT